MRDKQIDALKGLGIILVVLGHTTALLQGWIYSFHMPLFFFLSGYLRFGAARKTPGCFLLRKAKSTLLPYAMFRLVGLAIDSLKMLVLGWGYKASLPRQFLGFLLGGGYLAETSHNFPLWYLQTFFLCAVVFELMLRVLRTRGLCAAGLLLAFATLPFQHMLPERPAFHINVLPPALVFMLLGYGSACLLHKRPFTLTPLHSLLSGLGLLALGAFLSQPYGTNIAAVGRLSYFPGALCSIWGLFLLCTLLQNTRWLPYIGGCTLYIMGLHLPAADILSAVTGRLPLPTLAVQLLTAALSLALCCALKELLGRFRQRIGKNI